MLFDRVHTVGKRQSQQRIPSMNFNLSLKSGQPTVVVVNGIFRHFLPDRWVVPGSPAIM